MTKGYMVFVEGMNAPTVVHEDFLTAQKQAISHSLQHRGMEVVLLQIHKRFVKPVKAPENTEPEKLPTHLPARDAVNPKRKLGFKDLIFKEQLP